MKKLITTLLIGLPLLTAGSMAQAHESHHGGIRGSIGISIPLGNGGYLGFGTGPSYYPGSYYYPAPYYHPAPYVRSSHARGYRYRGHKNRYGYNDGRRSGYGHSHRRNKGREDRRNY